MAAGSARAIPLRSTMKSAKVAPPLLDLGLLPHAGPDVGVDDVGAPHGLGRAGGDRTLPPARRHAAPGRGRSRPDRPAAARSRAGSRPPASCWPCCCRPRPRPRRGHRAPPRSCAEPLGDGEQVGQHLAGVGGVGERVHHRHRGPAGHLLQLVVLEGADHQRVEVAGEHAGRVADGLAAAELRVARGEHHLRRARAGERPPRTRPGCGWRPSRRPDPRPGRPAGAAPASRAASTRRRAPAARAARPGRGR